jgi:hypothetical protein
MQDFILFFSMGWGHIISWGALDHILFVTALAAIYVIKDWRKVLVLVTAFTIGHSLTLALSVYNIIRINDQLVEVLIPITIFITAIFNLLQKDYNPKVLRLNYFFALFFGLIHGMGFANSIRFMLAKNETLGIPLFSFNLGLEVGQISVVVFVLLMSYLCLTELKLSRKIWVFALSLTALIFSVFMIVERI